ncbi:MAG: PAS domain-containing protein, partial [bacterium]|nr:PAS domain-containing protein [bacterium]
LRESEERFRWICETITDMVWLRYPGGERASFVSSGFGHIFKRPATDRHAVEGSWLPLVHPEDRDRVEALQKRTIEDSGYEVEYRIVRPDGDIRWVRERARPLSRGGIHAVAGLTADITAARNQREALRDYAAKLEQVQHVARAGCWEMDVASAKVFWSPQVNALLGVADHVELDGDQFLEFIHPEDRAALADEVEAALAGVREYDFEHRVLHSDGSVRHLHERARVDRDSDGRAVRMLGMAQDVTAWKHAEKRLADREAMLRQLIENTRDVFWLMDVDTRRVVYIGDGYAGAWGHQPRDDVPMPWFDDVYRYDRRRVRAAERRLIAEQRCDVEYRIKHPSGTLRWIRTRAFPVRDAAGNVVRVAGFSEETTEARAFAEMNRLRDLAEATSQAKTEFVAQISHELRTPLNA